MAVNARRVAMAVRTNIVTLPKRTVSQFSSSTRCSPRYSRRATCHIERMRQLLLLRHAKSSWDDPDLPDHARPLNARGKRAASVMAAVMRDLGLSPDIVLVSSARRTLQTLEAISPLPGRPLVEPMDDLYLASWQQLLETLRAAPETARSVLLIAHNPGLHDLALELAGHPAIEHGTAPGTKRLAGGYPTAALAEFSIAQPWHALKPQFGQLIRFIAPNDLPEMAA
jgi:phosphohistidine phosphatase